MEYQYDYPNVSKLLEWAKDRLQTGNYPKEPFQLNKCVKVNNYNCVNKQEYNGIKLSLFRIF